MNSHKSDCPIFIVGTPRSGTTLLRLIINSHPEIAITPESSFLLRVPWLWERLCPNFYNVNSVQRLIDSLRKLPQVKEWFPENYNARTLMQQKGYNGKLSDVLKGLFESYAKQNGKMRWGDKTPKNLHAIDDILKLFPASKFLVVIRDCRDVVQSLNMVDFSGVSNISATIRWRKDAEITRKLIEKYKLKIHLVKYEDLLLSPESTIKEIVDFCDLGVYQDLLQNYSTHVDDVVHSKSSLFLEPINKENIYKWKKTMPTHMVRECESIAGKELHYFGYEVCGGEGLHYSKTKLFLYRIKDGFHLLGVSRYLENYIVFAQLFCKMILRKVGV